MKKYLATRTVNHNNQEYQAGEPLQLDDKTAAPLLTVGAVKEKPAEAEQAPAEKDLVEKDLVEKADKEELTTEKPGKKAK